MADDAYANVVRLDEITNLVTDLRAVIARHFEDTRYDPRAWEVVGAAIRVVADDMREREPGFQAALGYCLIEDAKGAGVGSTSNT